MCVFCATKIPSQAYVCVYVCVYGRISNPSRVTAFWEMAGLQKTLLGDVLKRMQNDTKCSLGRYRHSVNVCLCVCIL